MPQKAQSQKRSYLVFTTSGAFFAEGISAAAALNRFNQHSLKREVLGIIREDLVIKPPSGPEAPPFLGMFLQGQLVPMPNPEGGK